MLVSWGDKYATGIPLIDNQHRELVNLTNELYKACRGGNAAIGAAFKETMSRMVKYVSFHFSTELKLLEEIGYPDYREHKAEHTKLINDILEAAKDFDGGKKFVPFYFTSTLKDWVFGHIAVSDKKYAFFVREQKKKGLLKDL